MRMRNIITNFLRNRFVRNVTVIATGTVIAQIITLLLIPLITRLYGPEAYGIMGTFMSMLAIIIPVAALTLPSGIVLPKNSIEAIDIIKASLRISKILSVVVIILLIFFYNVIADILNLESVSILLFLIPVVILTACISQVLRQWLIRQSEFNILSKISIFEPLIIYGGMVTVGFFFPLAWVLIVFIAAKSAVSALLIFLSLSKKKDNIFTKIRERKSNLKKTLYKFRDFPLFRAPQELINATSQNLPVLMLATLIGPAAAGFYSIGRTALSIPSQFIGNAVGDVFYPRVAKAANTNENITNLLQKATLTLFIIGVIPFGTVMIFGPELFSLVFGDDWYIAGQYARWLSIWILFNFSNKACIRVLPVLSAQGFHLKFTITTLVIRLMSLLWGLYFYQSDLVAIALFGLSGAILEVLLILITINKSKKFDMKRVERE